MHMINSLREIRENMKDNFEFGIIFKKSMDENEIYAHLSKTFRKM
jgi:hypothetical protein